MGDSPRTQGAAGIGLNIDNDNNRVTRIEFRTWQTGLLSNEMILKGSCKPLERVYKQLIS